MQPVAIFAHPAGLAGGVSNDEGVVGHGFCDDRACTDEGVASDVVSTNDGGIGTDGSAFFHKCTGVFALAVDGRTRVDHIGKNHGGSQEDVVFANHTGIDAHVVLYLDIATEHHLRTDNDILADVAVFANDAVGHDVAEMPDFGAVADLAVVVDDGGGVGEVSHK